MKTRKLKSSLNLYREYNTVIRTRKVKSKRRQFIVLFVSIFLVIAILAAGIHFKNLRLELLNGQMSDYLMDAENIKNYTAVQAVKSDIDALSDLDGKISETNEVLDEKDSINGYIFVQLYNAKPENTVLDNVALTNGQLTVTYHSPVMGDLSLFARNLESQSDFASVDYKGYQTSEVTIEDEGSADSIDPQTGEAAEPKTQTIYSGTVTILVRGSY